MCVRAYLRPVFVYSEYIHDIVYRSVEKYPDICRAIFHRWGQAATPFLKALSAVQRDPMLLDMQQRGGERELVLIDTRA